MTQKTSDNSDGLYVEIKYTPGGIYNWCATLHDSNAGTYWSSWVSEIRSDWRWLIERRARRLLANERKYRAQLRRAEEIGKVVIR